MTNETQKQEQTAGEILREKCKVGNSSELTLRLREKVDSEGKENELAKVILANRERVWGSPDARYSTDLSDITYPPHSSVSKRYIYPEVSDALNSVFVTNEDYVGEQTLLGSPKEKLPFLLDVLDRSATCLAEPMQARNIGNSGKYFALEKSGVNRNLKYHEVRKILSRQIVENLLDILSFGLDTHRISYPLDILRKIKVSKQLRDEDWKRTESRPEPKKYTPTNLTYPQWESYKRANLNSAPQVFDKAYSVLYNLFGGKN